MFQKDHLRLHSYLGEFLSQEEYNFIKENGYPIQGPYYADGCWLLSNEDRVKFKLTRTAYHRGLHLNKEEYNFFKNEGYAVRNLLEHDEDSNIAWYDDVEDPYITDESIHHALMCIN